MRVIQWRWVYLTKVTGVNDAILFVSGKSKENVKPSSEDDKEESNEPDYYEDQDQLEDSKRVQEKWPSTKFSNKVQTTL